IPQSDYRKLLALKTQLEQNKIGGVHGLTAQRDTLKKQITDVGTSISDLNSKLQKAAPGSIEHTNLSVQLADAQAKQSSLNAQYQDMIQNGIPQEQQLFTQSQQGNESGSWLQDNELIREWLATQNSTVQAKIEPSQDAINRAINAFITDMPKTTNYNKFLSDNHLSDADVHAMIALK